MIRKPTVAASFYPADKNSLINQINDFLNQAEKIKTDQHLSILLVPHAGIDYSGLTAAWGYKQIAHKNYRKIILLGCSHQVYFDYAAVWPQGSWQTPLGKVDVETKLAHALVNQSNQIKPDFTVHKPEHSLEIQLPFLQTVLKDFKIVPILLGQVSNQILQDLAQIITTNFDQQTLLIISSDLSHYPDDQMATKVDQNTIDAILTGNINQFDQVLEKNTGKNGVDTCACAAEAIKIGLMMTRKLGIKTIKLLNYTHSGQIGGDKNRVVGYTSIGFYQ